MVMGFDTIFVVFKDENRTFQFYFFPSGWDTVPHMVENQLLSPEFYMRKTESDLGVIFSCSFQIR